MENSTSTHSGYYFPVLLLSDPETLRNSDNEVLEMLHRCKEVNGDILASHAVTARSTCLASSSGPS